MPVFIKRLSQLLIILAIVFSGSFLMSEESWERSEKTGRSEEAIHSGDRASMLQKTVQESCSKEYDQYSSKVPENYHLDELSDPEQADFNIEHIYFSTYLRFQI